MIKEVIEINVAKVYLGGRFVYRTIRLDAEGLYIKYNNKRVAVRLDQHTKLYYVAVASRKPLDKLEYEYKQLVHKASSRDTTHEQLLEIRKQLSNIRRIKKTTHRSV